MTVKIDADRYYTPFAVASRALECAELTSQPVVCADTACGAGSLLIAAEDVLQAKYCLGIDNDPGMIRRLRRERPDWRLYVGDFLKRHRAPPTDFPGATSGVDLLVLNPPFSLGHRKYVSVKYLGESVKCSVAMAHILRGLELFRPNQGAIAVVPESLLHSNTDRHARELLGQQFSLSELFQLSIHTFKGARVNSSFVQFGCSPSKPEVRINGQMAVHSIPATVVRGGLQMHTFKHAVSGVQLIHSTSLKYIANDGISAVTDRTTAKAKGRVSGWMLLLPRVGIPKKEVFRAYYSKSEVQLSDCVIAMLFSSRVAATTAERRVRENWAALTNLYRGTGARYITVKRLIDWLWDLGVCDRAALEELGEHGLP